MNANVVNVAVVDGKTITQTVEISSVKNNQPVRIKAVQGGKYILAEGANGVAPENITIKRVGKDLHIALEGTDPDQPQLIIEDFEGSGGQLVGVAEDGSYHEYISSDAEQDRSAAFLIEGLEAPQVLGAQPLTGFGDGLAAAAGIGWFWPALLGLAALGVLGGIYAATRDDDNDDDKVIGSGNADKGSIDHVDDNVGDKIGLIENGGSTDDRTPTFTGEGRPGTSVEIVDNGKTIGTAIVGEDGKWEYTPPEPGLEDGKHEIVIVPVDENGNKGEPSPGYEIIVDTVAPSRPLIDGIYDDVAPQEGQIGSGGHTNDTTPTLSGTGEADAIIHIYDNGVEIGSVLADNEGNWSFTPDPALIEGAHEFTVTAEDTAGNISTPSLPFPIIVDITVPGKPGAGTGGIDDVQDNVDPHQGSIGDGDTTDDDTPTIIGGGAEPGDTVTIIDNGVEIGTAIVGEDGSWEFTPDPALLEGSHELVVVITDPAGNESEPSDPYTIIIDTTAPVAPTLTSVFDDQGAATGNLTSGDNTDDARPDLSGTAEAGSLVTIYDNGVAIGSVIATDGTWTFTPTVPLSNGAHTISATSSDVAGNVSPPTQGFDLVVNAGGAPVAPAIISVVDDQGSLRGPLQQNDFTDDAHPTINGTGADGSVISVFANGVLLGTTSVVGGQWSFTPTTPLDEGLNNLSALATDAAGNPSPATGNYPVNVDTSAPLAPTGQSLFDNVGTMIGLIVSGDTTDDANPAFSGTAEAGAVVMIYDNGNLIGSTSADPTTGAWSFTPAMPLDEGAHSFAAQAVDRAGNASPMGPSIPFTVDTSGVVISITSVVDNVDPVSGNLTSGQTTDDTTPTLNGRATPGGIVTIYDGTTPLGTVMADVTTGLWSFTTPPLMTEGSHSLTATVTTPATGESPPTAVFEVIIDTVAPLAPSIGDVADDVGSSQITVPDGGFTDDTTPTLSGNGLQPGDVVMIYDNGLLIGSAPVIGNGSWSFTPTETPLNDGAHPFTVVAVDPAGNSSLPSQPWTVVVDTFAPLAPTGQSLFDNVGTIIGLIVSGDTTDDANPAFSGTAEAGAVVMIYDNGNLIGSTSADPTTGAWSFTPAMPLDEGAHSFAAQAVDRAGNASPMGPSIPFTVDTSGVVISITSVVDNVDPVSGNLTSGQTTDDTTPTLNGRATPGGIVTIYDGTTPLGTVTADATTGLWSFTTPPLVTEGSHSLTATVTTPATGESPPTAVFEVIIDTVAPLAPSIGDVNDNEGAIRGTVSDGSSTDDNTPTLSGNGLQPGDVVMIYDNGLLIGSAPVIGDGSWSFMPATPLDDGTHPFTVVAVDPAGNSSLPSAPWTVIVDTEAPIAAATIDSMGKDSGANSGDFVTNDGSAGRLIQGSLTAALEAGERVQISTDNGATWSDVLMGTNGTWSFIDQNSHSANWAIQTRVTDVVGNANSTSQAVILDNSVVTPDLVTWDGADVTVGFDGSDLQAGNLLHVLVDGLVVEHVLTQAEIDAGSATFAGPSGLVGNPDSIRAAVVDSAGNVSDYRLHEKQIDVLFDEDFSTVANHRLDTGGPLVLGDFTLSSMRTSGVVANEVNIGSGNTGGAVTQPASSQALMFGGDVRLALNPGETASVISFNIGDITFDEILTVNFYSESGNIVHTVDFNNPSGLEQHLDLELPIGLSFNYMDFSLAGLFPWVWIDNIEIGAITYPDGGTVPPDTQQDIIQETGYYGDGSDNVFSIADVQVFDSSATVIEAGAGTDTLLLTGTGQVLDLSAIAGKLESIEIIDLTGTGNNTLSLSLGDVLEQGETSLFTNDETVQMMVKGNTGDVVNLDDLLPDGTDPGDWATAGTATVAGVTYNVFQHSTLDAQLLVQDGVTTNLV